MLMALPLPAGTTQIRLVASCVGDQLTLVAGDKVLASVRDGEFGRGDLGLIAGTLDRPGLVVGFDNFLVRAP